MGAGRINYTGKVTVTGGNFELKFPRRYSERKQQGICHGTSKGLLGKYGAVT
jgi:hypothetical protein